MSYQTQGFGGQDQYGGGYGGQGGYDQYGAPPTQYDQGYGGNPNYSQGGYGPDGNYPGQSPPNQGGMPPSVQGPPGVLGGLGGLKTSSTPDWSVGFFMAACSVMLGASIAAIALFFSFELVDFIEMCYMFLFAGVLAVMDTPCFKTMKTVKDHREYFSKYVNLLTRVTGKGITFVFLGSALFSGMWDNLEGMFLLFLAFVLSLLPVVVGIAAVVIGFMKSQKLNRARLALANDESNLPILYEQFAKTYPGPYGGLIQLEFNDLTNKAAGIKWEDADLKLIFNALVSNPAWRTTQQNPMGNYNQAVEMAKIPREDFLAWVKGGMVWL